MKTLKGLFLMVLVTGSLPIAQADCLALDPNEVMAKLTRTERISEAMAVRESYQPSLCSLGNIEIVSRVETIPGLPGEIWPRYRSEISRFVLQALRRLSPGSVDFSSPEKPVIARILSSIEDAAEGYAALGALAGKCSELAWIFEEIPCPSGISELELNRIVRGVFSREQDRVGCKAIRY